MPSKPLGAHTVSSNRIKASAMRNNTPKLKLLKLPLWRSNSSSTAA